VSDGSKRTNGIKSVVKTLRLLKLFPTAPCVECGENGLVVGIPQKLGAAHFGHLEKEGFLSKVTPRRSEYRLGPDILFLGNVAEVSMDRALSPPDHGGPGAKGTGNVLPVRGRPGQCLYIEKAECSHPIRIIHQVGQRNPLYCTGVGKALMSGMSDEEIERLIQNAKTAGAHPPHDHRSAKTQARTGAVRKKGIAQDKEELNLGVKCVAAPIRNRSGAVVAAISLSGPTQRFTQPPSDALKRI